MDYIMKRHPRYFILGYGHEDVRPLPKVSDDMIDKLYEKIIPYDGKHNEFRGTKREYVAKIIEVFGGMVGSGNGTDGMDDDEAEYEIDKIIDNAEDLLGKRDISQREALAALYGPSGVSSRIGEFHETFVEENVLNKLAEKNKLTNVTKFKDYKKDGRDIGAITDFGALKNNGKTALFEVKTSLEAQPTKFVVAARTLDDDKFAKEYNILFTDTRDNTVKKLDITKLIKDMPDRPRPSDDMFNKLYLKEGDVNRLEMDGRMSKEWNNDGDDIMKWMQDQGYGSITTKKNGAKMFRFNQTNPEVSKNIKTVYRETQVDPHSTQARPMSSAAPAFVPTSARSVAKSVAADVDELDKRREEEMEQIRAAEEKAARKAEKRASAEAKEAAKRAKDAAPAPVATPIETKAQRKARLAAIEEAKKAEAAAIEEKKKAEREKSKQMAAELEAKKKAKDAEEAKKKAEDAKETAKKAQNTQKKSKDTKKKQKPVDDDDALFAEAAAVRAKYEAEQAAIKAAEAAKKAAEAAKKAAAEAAEAAKKAAERETLNTLAKAAAEEVKDKCNELKKPANTLIESINELKTYNPDNFSERDKATVLKYNDKIAESGALGSENMGYMNSQFPYNLILIDGVRGVETYIKEEYYRQKSSRLPIETIVETTKNTLITEAKKQINEVFDTNQIEQMKSMVDDLKDAAAAIKFKMIIKPKK